MAEPPDLDAIMQEIRGQLRAELKARDHSPPPQQQPAERTRVEAQLKEIRGPAAGRAGLAGFAAHFLVPAIGVMALAALLLSLR